MLLNKLGEFTFIRIDPPPMGPAQVSAIESYPGVDGHSYWLLGEKGEPVAVTTVADVLPDGGQTGVGVAMVLFRYYQQTIGQRLPMWYAGLEITDWRYQVVGVRQVAITPQLRSVGGTSGGGVNGALLVAEWLIVPELQTAEEEA